MGSPAQDQLITVLLEAARSETDPPPLDRVVTLVYDDLRVMAAGHLRARGTDLTLSPTELVHEAYLRLADSTRVTSRGRAYFFAAAARAMRRITADHARRRHRLKRGGGERPLTLDNATVNAGGGPLDVLDLERGLEHLEVVAERPVRVVECRFFGGLSIDDTALALGVTARTVNRDWQFARAWLYDFLRTTAAEQRK